MANVLTLEKQTMAIHALVEGSSIRSIERMTGIHRDTIMRLGVKVGESCQDLLDQKMRNLELGHVQVDEIWGFIGKKQKQVSESDKGRPVGDVWTYIALDQETKLIPSYLVGKRDRYHTNSFMYDLASRVKIMRSAAREALGLPKNARVAAMTTLDETSTSPLDSAPMTEEEVERQIHGAPATGKKGESPKRSVK